MFHVVCPECKSDDTLEMIVRDEHVYKFEAFPSPTDPKRGTYSARQKISTRSSHTSTAACSACGWSRVGCPSSREIIVQK